MTFARSTCRNRPRTFAIVPMKSLDQAKQRLAPALSPSQRQDVTRAMFEDVLITLRSVQLRHHLEVIDRIIVVTRDTGLAALATSFGAQVIGEPDGCDLNQSIALGIEIASHEEADRILIVPGDVPLATAAEIEAILSAASEGKVAIAPDAAGEGTNALLLPLPMSFLPAFGPASFERHRALARDAGIDAAIVRGDGIGQDIDTEADLAALTALPRYDFLGDRTPGPLSRDAALALVDAPDLNALMSRAEAVSLAGHGTIVTYSRKVFIPLTQLCRDVCHYCTFAHAPRELKTAYLPPDEVLAIARAGQAAGLQGGAVYARRQAGAALCGRSRGAG